MPSAAERVLGLLLPERDSSSDALRLATLLADDLGIERIVEDIAPALTAVGCYARQDEAVRMAFPDFGRGGGSSSCSRRCLTATA